MSKEALSATVHWLAAPEREGRATGTPGAQASAEYLAEQLKNAGVQPLGDSYFRALRVSRGREGARRQEPAPAHHHRAGPRDRVQSTRTIPPARLHRKRRGRRGGGLRRLRPQRAGGRRPAALQQLRRARREGEDRPLLPLRAGGRGAGPPRAPESLRRPALQSHDGPRARRRRRARRHRPELARAPAKSSRSATMAATPTAASPAFSHRRPGRRGAARAERQIAQGSPDRPRHREPACRRRLRPAQGESEDGRRSRALAKDGPQRRRPDQRRQTDEWVVVGAHYDHLGRGGSQLAGAGRARRSKSIPARTTTRPAARWCWRSPRISARPVPSAADAAAPAAQARRHLLLLERRRDGPARQRRLCRKAARPARQDRRLHQLRHGRPAARRQAHHASRRQLQALAQGTREAQRRRRLQPRPPGRPVPAHRRHQLLPEAHPGPELLHRRARGLPPPHRHARQSELRRDGADREIRRADHPRRRHRRRAPRLLARRAHRKRRRRSATPCAPTSAPSPTTRRRSKA